MVSVLQHSLAVGRSALLGVAGRTVTFPGHGNARAVVLIDEAVEDRDRRRAPDFNLRRGIVVEVDACAIPHVPEPGEYVMDDLGRRHRIQTVSRRAGLLRLECEPIE